MDIFDEDCCVEPLPDSTEPHKKKRRAVLRKQDRLLILQTIRTYNADTLSSLILERTQTKLQNHRCGDARAFSLRINASELLFVVTYLQGVFCKTYESCSTGIVACDRGLTFHIASYCTCIFSLFQ